MGKNSETTSGPCWKPSPDIASRKVADELVLLNVKTSEYYSLNPTALFVWELISRNTPLDGILKAFAEEFDADAARIKKDVLELIKTLESQKVICKS
ncbi:MAG: PqqD family protein [Elusimicrobiales bacterium]|nr:PqqD family protein [Elusimicrobiales bacterium]